MSVINLFDLGQKIHNPNQLLQRYMTIRKDKDDVARTDAPANTADPSKRMQLITGSPPKEHPMSAGERLETTSSM